MNKIKNGNYIYTKLDGTTTYDVLYNGFYMVVSEYGTDG
jgi:hypothetical protein